MALYVYITENCKDDARHHALSDDIERFKTRVEKSQSTSQFDPFPPPYLVKKKLGGRQGRLIANLLTFGEDAVVIFLAIMIRGDRAYEDHFGPDPIGYGAQHFSHLVSGEQISAYIAERTRTEPPPVKPQPDDAEYAFLYEAFTHRQNATEEDVVYETVEWKDAVGEERIANQLVRFAEPCIEALDLEPGIHFVDVPGKKGWGVWLYRDEGRMLLVTPVTDTTQEAAKKIADRYREMLKTGSLAHIIRSSRRAYPAFMLVEEDTWVEIEKEPVANMALSPEESEVLISARRSENAFPLFVNGRAGSGKSTILQYLFADLLYYYLVTERAQLMAPPIYLTANGELLRVARSFVERVLKSEAAFRQSDRTNLVEENREILDEAFREFQPFLLSLIEQKIRLEKFAPARRIDYSQFRVLWTEWFGMDRNAGKEFGADISWHVVRSYIKGMLSETLMDPDEYAQLPQNQLTVTPETFQTVYERVWEARYRPYCEARGFWDDQDLTRFILDNDLARPVNPAVLCDEAQDFTRIELELLLRLNLYSDRSVPPHDLSRVPFAFAGDQFQTLNPTGFRWDSIKVSFIEKFIHALDPAGRSGRTELNYHELQFNYRSTPPIVRFSNGVQAFRASVLKIPELRPQTPWSIPKNVFPVVWFDSADADFWRKFKETESFVVIVPCNEGEEAAYVAADPALREHIRVEDGIPLNVLSASRAKGREYPGVIVYGFGNAAPEKLKDLAGSDDLGRMVLERNEALPIEYFISRLYVAVSRPKQRLIVVDSNDGIHRLWSFAHIEEVLNRVVTVANRGGNIWSSDAEDSNEPAVQAMVMGKAGDIVKESVGDPLENAKAFEEDGRARKDPFFFRQAALAYRTAGQASKAIECRARALELEGDYFSAARSYNEAGFVIPETVRCYWMAEKPGREALIELGKQNANVARETEFKCARVIEDADAPIDQIIEILREVADRLSDSDFAVYVSAHWMTILQQLLLRARASHEIPKAKDLEQIMTNMESFGVVLPDRITAEIYYSAGNLGKAVHHWEKAGETKSEAYIKAKASVEPYPHKLLALSKAGAFEAVIGEYERRREVPLEAELWSAVAAAYLTANRFGDAFDAAWEAHNSSIIRRISLCALGQKDEAQASRALLASILTMVFEGEWEPLGKFASTLDFSPDVAWSDAHAREMVESHSRRLQCALVDALARSEKFPSLSGHSQRQFNDFLRRFLRVRDGQWQSGVTVEAAGAAIERGGRFTDALGFYEAVLKDANFSGGEKNFVKARWLVCKTRQLEYERQQGGQHKRVTDLQRELSEATAAARVARVSDFPKYPELPDLQKPGVDVVKVAEEVAPVGETDRQRSTTAGEGEPVTDDPAVELADRINFSVADFEIGHSRKLGRCNISHKPTMQTAFVNIREETTGGEVAWREAGKNEWFCETWGVRIIRKPGTLGIRIEQFGVEAVITRPIA